MSSERLIDAVWEGDIERVKNLIQNGANVNGKGKGWAALHSAAWNVHAEIVSILIGARCDIEIKNEKGWTALHCAANQGHTEVVSLLIDAGCDINVQAENGWASLHYAAWKGHLRTASLLIEARCNLNLQNKFGQTALHLVTHPALFEAAPLPHEGHWEIVSQLVKAGADIFLQDNDDETAFEVAKLPQVRQLFRSKFKALIETFLPQSWELQTETVGDLIASFICG